VRNGRARSPLITVMLPSGLWLVDLGPWTSGHTLTRPFSRLFSRPRMPTSGSRGAACHDMPGPLRLRCLELPTYPHAACLLLRVVSASFGPSGERRRSRRSAVSAHGHNSPCNTTLLSMATPTPSATSRMPSTTSALLVVVVTWQRRGMQPNRRVASLALRYAVRAGVDVGGG
jgi:hypothetical protein